MPKKKIKIIRQIRKKTLNTNDSLLFNMDVEEMLDSLPEAPIFDLVITSPPYNIGKEYEEKMPLNDYLEWQERIIKKIYLRLKDNGSICWQVGNYLENGCIFPLDIELSYIFRKLNLKLRNRIIWHFGHGMHNKKSFSRRYEVVMWYTKSDDYTFNLDDVRIPAKYPGKKYTRGAKKGQISGNPLGKNPEDVWDIPNVKAQHVEKTAHPCQFPVGLIERLVLALSNENDLVFDPFSGVASCGVAALLHDRKYWGCEKMDKYNEIAKERLNSTINGTVKYRPYDKPIMDPKESSFSKIPEEWSNKI